MTVAQERTLAPSETAERLAMALLARAGSRVTADIAEIFEAIDAVEPSLATAPWKRERIGELLAELAAAGFLEPSRTRFDRSEAPALPAFVRLVARRAPGRIVAAAAGYPWRPELAWAASEPLLEREFEQLKAVQAFLRDGGANRRLVPAPERSLELFGHEKALDEELRPSRLWADGRMSYVLLRCRPVATPLPHRVVGRGSWLLVAENAAAFDSIAASIPDGSPVGIVGWGGGGLFRSTVESVAELPAITAREEIAAIRYFGDLDVEGLRIPIAASAAAERVGLPPVRPAVGLYARLLAVGRPQRATPVAPEVAAELTAWLGSALAPQAAALLVSGYRLAQEGVGLDQLVENRLWATPAGLGPGRSGTPTGAAAAATPRPQRKAQPALSGDLVLMRDDDGRQIIPRTEAEWADWVPAARTRNWVLGDPLLDWLHAHGSAHGFLRDDERPGYDPRTDFQRLVREKGIAFEAGVLRLLNRRVPVRVVARAHGDGRSLEKARETLEALCQGVPAVAQAVLRNPESRTFGVADLLVRSDVLATWFPELLSWEDATVGAPGLGHTRFHYRAIDIKFHTFELAADCHVVGSVDQLAHAVEVWIYADALARLQGYIPPAAYLLGRTWQRGDERGDGCLDRLARVDVHRWLANREISLANLASHASAWIRRLRSEGHHWHVFPEPSVPELYPHARNPEDAPWHAAKREIAERLGELTLLPAMNPERRAAAHAAGYRRWTDPGLSAAILGVTNAAYAARIDAVLEANLQAVATVIPHRITKADPVWREIRPVEFFVDFETISNLDDDLVCLPAVGGQPQIVQVGCGHLDRAGCWVFAQWTADALDVGEERRILDTWLGHMANVCRAADVTLVDARICHWSAAEPVNLESAYNAARTRHPDGDWPAEMPWFDVLQCVIRAEPVSVTGAFNFGLKAIAKAMHDASFIQTTWRDGPTDGLGAMTAMWSAAREAVAAALPLSQHELIVEIGHYNEVDCLVMAEILQWLRANR